ncbi:hypothetical protein CERZMDRAFT_116494 [Cercospora zeae-maydis SCOH1-5]|uniref:Uncharacterized protein n=1 Tax=Cercospora zeae-maydis SCOH1-5 TaxID=717836 RepID=A0A6A6FQ12_9PEZI|nr:hypothetical protein CERZMDRAFT_116494 [Cercospora zeae-maydis SCOH1-5]
MQCRASRRLSFLSNCSRTFFLLIASQHINSTSRNHQRCIRAHHHSRTMAYGQKLRLVVAASLFPGTVHADVHNATTYGFRNLTASKRHHSDMKDDYIGHLDTGAFRRLVYHNTDLGAQSGRDLGLLHRKGFEDRCRNDAECHLALEGLTASVSRSLIGMEEPVCPHKNCDAEDLVQVFSQKHNSAAQSAYLRTLMLADNYGKNDSTIHLDLRDAELAVVAVTQKWLEDDHVDEHKLKKFRKQWTSGVFRDQNPARDWYSNVTLIDKSFNKTSTGIRGSLFMESLFNGPTCLGDSYLCPVDKAQREAVIPVLSVLRSIGEEGILDQRNPCHVTLNLMLVANRSSTDLGWIVEKNKIGRKKTSKARAIAEKFMDEANANHDALRAVSENMVYTTEVFDRFRGRLWHANLRWDDSRTIDPGLRMLGYLPLIAHDDSTMPMLGYEQTRHVDDLRPITAGYWQAITVPRPPRLADEATNASTTHGKRSEDNGILAPARNYWHLPSEGGLVPHPSLVSRRDLNRKVEVDLEFQPRQYQVRTGAEGGIMTDSMGNPLTRAAAIVADDDEFKIPPIMHSVDTTVISGGMASVMAVRMNNAAGKEVMLAQPITFQAHPKSSMQTGISRGERHVRFPEQPESINGLRMDYRLARESWWPWRSEQHVFRQWIRHEMQKQQILMKEWQAELLDVNTLIKSPNLRDEYVPGEKLPRLRQRRTLLEQAIKSSQTTHNSFKDLKRLEDLSKINSAHPRFSQLEALRAERGVRIQRALEHSRSTFRLRRETGLLRVAEDTANLFGRGSPAASELRAAAERVAKGQGIELDILMDESALNRFYRDSQYRFWANSKYYLDRSIMPTRMEWAGSSARDLAERLILDSDQITHDLQGEGRAGAAARRAVRRVWEFAASPSRAQAAARLQASRIKVPLGVWGGWAMAGLMVVGAVAELVTELMDDHTCQRPAYRTELWNPEVADAEIIMSPCTNTKSVFLPTPTSMAPLVVTFGAPEPTGPSAWLLPGGIPLGNASSPGVAFPNATQLNASHVIAPSSTVENATATEEDFACHTTSILQDYMYVRTGPLPCPIPTPRECGIDWFHQHVNDLPAGLRSPEYCSTGSLVGHARAQVHNCLPSFESKKCKKMFGLDKETAAEARKKVREKQKEEDEEYQRELKKHKEEEKEKKKEEKKKQKEGEKWHE